MAQTKQHMMRLRLLPILLLSMTLPIAVLAQTPDELVTSAVLKFESGEYDACAADIETALASEADLSAQSKAQAYLYQGRLYLRKQMEAQQAGDEEAWKDAPGMAYASYTKASEADDGTVKPVIDAQLRLLSSQLFNEAVGAYNNSRQLAEGAERTSLLQRAEEYSSFAYEIRPSDYRMSYLRGLVLYTMENYEEALNSYLIARRFYPRRSANAPDFRMITNIFRSVTIILRDKVDRPNFDRALESAQAGQQWLDGEYERWKRDFSSKSPEGEEQYREGRKTLIREELSTFHQMGRRLNEAIPAFEAALAGDFVDDDQMHMVYGTLIWDEDWSRAAEVFALAAKINPENFAALYNRALLFNQQGVKLYNQTLNRERSVDEQALFEKYFSESRKSAEQAHAVKADDPSPLQLLKQAAELTNDDEAAAAYDAKLKSLGGD